MRKLASPAPLMTAQANKSVRLGRGRPRPSSTRRSSADVAMRLNPADKMCGKGKIEKHILRALEDLLPHEVAWRRRSSSPDGGLPWIDSLKAMRSKR